MMYKLIDLFAGAGGLTTGFHLAGFDSLCAIDIDAKALATYQHNYPNTKFTAGRTKRNDWWSTLSRFLKECSCW
jgi:site-specific DNA-cytosine methylase